MGSSLGVSRVTGYVSFNDFRVELESYWTSVVPYSGDKLGSQEKVGYATLAPFNVSSGSQ
jgi:hypothetical protein